MACNTVIQNLTLPSPVHRLEVLSDHWGIDLWVKRDDLIPEYLGGNKTRKVFHIFRSWLESGVLPQVVITNGGTNSNHARVVALMGARLGCEVHLVLHGNPPAKVDPRGNAFFFEAAGAAVTYVPSSAVSDTIHRLRQTALERDRSVMVIPGGGHTASAVTAYSDAFAELPFVPDAIVLASGTGGTQAGLIVGAAVTQAETRIIGVSVARESERGAAAVRELLPPDLASGSVLFNDSFRFGGYECWTDELMEFVRFIARLEGLPVDPTYTAKALFGLGRLCASGEIRPGDRVVFWHTGGLLNLTSCGWAS